MILWGPFLPAGVSTALPHLPCVSPGDTPVTRSSTLPIPAPIPGTPGKGEGWLQRSQCSAARGAESACDWHHLLCEIQLVFPFPPLFLEGFPVSLSC